jgi:DNA-binding transcriptional ArsR family regulator
MTTGTLDPQIHDPARLRIVATLAGLPDGDELSVTRLQAVLGLMPGSLLTGLRELDRAGYVRIAEAGTSSGSSSGLSSRVAPAGRARAVASREVVAARRKELRVSRH